MSSQHKTLILFGSILTIAILFLLWQKLCFNSTNYYRKLIAEANSLVITYFILNPEEYGEVVATISDKEQLRRLSSSVKLHGFWFPWVGPVMSSFRIRMFRNGVHCDIIVTQDGHIREGTCTVNVHNKLVATTKALIKESGAKLPDLKRILEQAMHPPEDSFHNDAPRR